MADADDTNGKAPVRRKDAPIAAPSPFPSQNLGALPMGAMGQGLQSSGPAEWVSLIQWYDRAITDRISGMAHHESIIAAYFVCNYPE
jgi:hypothetical protein